MKNLGKHVWPFLSPVILFLFSVHVLASGELVFYTYNQTEEKLGADDVYMLDHFFSIAFKSVLMR